MRRTKLCIGIILFVVLAVFLSGGSAFAINPTESSQDKMTASLTDKFFEEYNFDQANACIVTQPTDGPCLEKENNDLNNIFLAKKKKKAAKKKKKKRGQGDCVKECIMDGGNARSCACD